MFFSMLRKAFTKGLRSKFLAIITIAFGASLAGAMLTVTLDVGDKVNKELKTYGANLMVEPQRETIPVEIGGVDYNPLTGNEHINESNLQKLKMIFWANNIVAFAPYLEVTGRAENGSEFLLVGTWFDKPLQIDTGEKVATGVKQMKTWWEVKGSWVDDLNPNNGVMVGNKIAQNLKLAPGDTFNVVLNTDGGKVSQEMLVRGVIEGGNEDEQRIYAPLKLVQDLTGLEGKVAKVEVSALTTPENELARKAERDKDSLTAEEFERWYCTAYVTAIAYQIEEVIPGVVAKPIRKVASSEGVILSKIQLLMALLTLTALISSALGISSLMTTKVLERSKEIGLMKALGAENWQVVLLFLSEASITGLLGGIAGYGIGLGFAQVIGRNVFGTSLSFNMLVIPIVLILSVGVAMAGSFSAMRMIIGMRPAEVLHGGR
ncbi:MAG: ABC transporter permease [Thermincola sp.]|nr:ABC transporter permease [Thermincola sp.]